ncbi:hypothetical protein Zmor_010291 [Zophobas morio]|uniref:Odorant receptor n=1 Tax=Zophobas morio TaxID=2755281 RepID=A0AA38IQS4_9CUCU|nr:hypothetical protein Zmor_010291 [Zophobas morio]
MTATIQQSFQISLNVLHIFGLYISEQNSTFLKVRGYTLYIFLLILGTFLIVINLIVEKNITGMQMNLMVTFAAETVSMWFKVYPFLRNAERIQKCINYFGQREFAPKDQEEKKIIDECIGICRRNCVAYFCSVVVTEIIWSLPLFFTKEKTFQIYLWLPYDPFSSDLIYYITAFYTTAVVVYDGVLGTVTDPLIGGLAYHATAQLKILKYNLEHLDKHIKADVDKNNNEFTMINYKNAYQHLKHCIGHHNSILSFVTEYEECFSRCVFWQLAGSLFALCFSCIGLTLAVGAVVDALMYWTCAVMVCFQILFYCHYGTLLYEENNSLINAVYMGPWYRYDVKIRKILLTIMERSKRPMILTAGAVIPVTLDTFVSVLKSSYSLIAVLNNYD